MSTRLCLISTTEIDKNIDMDLAFARDKKNQNFFSLSRKRNLILFLFTSSREILYSLNHSRSASILSDSHSRSPSQSLV